MPKSLRLEDVREALERANGIINLTIYALSDPAFEDNIAAADSLAAAGEILSDIYGAIVAAQRDTAPGE